MTRLESKRPAKLSEVPPGSSKPGLVYFAGRAVLTPLGRFAYRIRVVGKHNVPTRGAVLFASNHLAARDSIIIPLAVPRRVQFLAKSHYFERARVFGRIQRWFFNTIGAVPVKRGAGGAAQTSLNVGRDILRSGGTFAIYPEGTRSRDGRLYRGRTGVAWLALETGATVIPVGLIGSDRGRLLRPDGTPGKKSPITVSFGPPVDFSGLSSSASGKDRREATDRIMAAIHTLTGQERAEGYNEISAT
ncbi:lysophospholipid acyltransferase family protein [Lysinibacter sp. HNR]|uniref:lysophospholipid acyltransferase family protein n=1 Tax=Lysinibacter sp. HNR TaxID=3031408 RepID=UPI00243484F3|nr:lysophospholipid acyltransferase family protein [Lysinibacter sp. HNR]WGD37975.1 lysophospholipid acyltransferase family protein [Lysinibacter sp. HNR]